MSTPGPVEGTVAGGFEPVADAFAAAVAASPRGGAALSIMVGGRPVVDLWGGLADPAHGRPWTRDTPAVMFSCSKGLLAVLVARLVEAGRINLNAPVSSYWPEFGQAGKDTVPVRWLLSHRAGLSYPIDNISKADIIAWDPVVEKLAAQAPLWTPGSGWAYHALTYGWLVGELVRRVTGQTLRQAFQELVAGPVHAPAWFGVPAEQLSSVAEIAAMPGLGAEMFADLPDGVALVRSLTLGGAVPISLVGDHTGFNDPDLRAAQIPGAGAVGTAASVAAIWSSTVVPTPSTQPVDREVVADMTRPQTAGPPVFGIQGAPAPQWATGFMIDSPVRPLLSSSSFGHDGAGGQLGFADPTAGVGFGFLTSDMGTAEDTRAVDILTALRLAL